MKRCTEILSNGETSPLDETKRQEILKTNTSLAKQALRVLGMAYKYVETIPAEMSSELVEKDLTFAGLVGMIDPERKEAADAVKVAKEAGIRPIMITGDHRDTAEAIAARLGIIKEGDDDAVITGAELNELSDENSRKSWDTTLSMLVFHQNTRFGLLKRGNKKEKWLR